MSETMELKIAHSRESEIDRQVDELIRKLVATPTGLTRQEEALLVNLMVQRSRLMRPPMPRIKVRGPAPKYAA